MCVSQAGQQYTPFTPIFPTPMSSVSVERALSFPSPPPRLGVVSGAVPGGPTLWVRSAGPLYLQPPGTWLRGCTFRRQQRDQLLCDPA